MISASHPYADIRAFMNRSNRKAPTILRAGAIRDHRAGYLRRDFRSQASLTTVPHWEDVAAARAPR
jgi:hypothetical protein